jgi:hypothetical protein
MSKMSDQVRRLVGLENLLTKARLRHRECRREEGSPNGPRALQYAELVERLSEELHSTDRAQLEEYLAYLEETLLSRVDRKVEALKERMVNAALELVDARTGLNDLRSEFTDALDRIRSLRERLGRDPFRPLETHFGLGVHPPNAERRVRDAHALVKEFLRS